MADEVVAPNSSPAPPAIDPAAPKAAAAPTDVTLTPEAQAAADALKAAEAAKAAKPADTPKAPAAPDKYDYTAVKLPEGITLDVPLLAAVEPIFRELGINQEGASKLVQAHAKALVDAEAQRQTDFNEWMKTNVAADHALLKKQLGSRYDTEVATSQKGLARLTTVEDGFFSAEEKAEAMRVLDEAGLGSKPWFFKIMSRVGKMVSEDKPPNGGPAPNAVPREVRMYPNSAAN